MTVESTRKQVAYSQHTHTHLGSRGEHPLGLGVVDVGAVHAPDSYESPVAKLLRRGVGVRDRYLFQ